MSPSTGIHMAITVNGGFTAGNTANSTFEHNTSFGINEDLTMIRGAHQLGFGAFFARTIEWKVGNAFSTGNFTIGNSTGLGMADFFLGIVSQFRQANPNPLDLNQNIGSLYWQDIWKVTPKLTMTYGLKWNPYSGSRFNRETSTTSACRGFTRASGAR